MRKKLKSNVIWFYFCNKYFDRNVLRKKFKFGRFILSDDFFKINYSKKNFLCFLSVLKNKKKEDCEIFKVDWNTQNFDITEVFGSLKNFNYHSEMNFQNELILKSYLKKNKKFSFSDSNVFLLKMRNKIYNLLKDLIYKKLNTFEQEEIDKEEKLECERKLKLEKCGSLIFKIEKLQIIKKPKKKKILTALNSIRKSKISDILKLLKHQKTKNTEKIQKIFNKIQLEIEEKKKEEEIFLEKTKEKSTNNQNLTKKENWLYNTKTFLTPEKKYLKIFELKKKLKNHKKIHEFQNHSPIKKDSKKKLTKCICQVCNSGDYNEKNRIILCDFCNVSVHQDCIGLLEIPEKEWICQSCKAFGENGKYLKCYLCSCRGGVFYKSRFDYDEEVFSDNQGYKRLMGKNYGSLDYFYEKIFKNWGFKGFKRFLSKESLIHLGLRKELGGKKNSIIYDYYLQNFKFCKEELEFNEPVPRKIWIHFSCGFWNSIPYKNQNFYHLDNLESENSKYKCYICQKVEGFCVKCRDKNCQNRFHVECARRCDLYLMEIRESPHFIIFCGDHIPLKLNKVIKDRDIMAIEDIDKFLYKLKNIFKEEKIEIWPDILKKQKKSLKKKNENFKLKIMPKEKKRDRVKRIVKNICQSFPEWQFKIKLINTSQNNYVIKNIIEPQKIFLIDQIEKKSEIWKLASEQLKIEKKSIWKYFNFKEKKISNIGCIYCKKFGRGLYKCENCWNYRLHSKCLNIFTTKKEEVSKHFLFCPICVKNYRDTVCKKEKNKIILCDSKDTCFYLKKVWKENLGKGFEVTQFN